MTHRAAETGLRISRGDSLKKLVLARGDETPTREARKFFHCQKLRLRVRATPFQGVAMSRNDAARLQFVVDANDENTCGTGTSCNLDNRRRSVFAHYSHRLADAPR